MPSNNFAGYNRQEQMGAIQAYLKENGLPNTNDNLNRTASMFYSNPEVGAKYAQMAGAGASKGSQPSVQDRVNEEVERGSTKKAQPTAESQSDWEPGRNRDMVPDDVVMPSPSRPTPGVEASTGTQTGGIDLQSLIPFLLPLLAARPNGVNLNDFSGPMPGRGGAVATPGTALQTGAIPGYIDAEFSEVNPTEQRILNRVGQEDQRLIENPASKVPPTGPEQVMNQNMLGSQNVKPLPEELAGPGMFVNQAGDVLDSNGKVLFNIPQSNTPEVWEIMKRTLRLF